MNKRLFYIIDERSVGSRDEFSISLPRKWARERNIRPKQTITFCAGEVGIIIPPNIYLNRIQLWKLMQMVETQILRFGADIWVDTSNSLEDLKNRYPDVWERLKPKLKEDGFL